MKQILAQEDVSILADGTYYYIVNVFRWKFPVI